MRTVAGVSVGVAIFLAAAAGIVVYSETATVTLSLPLQVIQTQVTLTGTRDSTYFPTRQLGVQVEDSLESPASPVTVSTFATGEVVFTYYSPCRSQCSTVPYIRVMAGADVSTATGIHYTTLADSGVFLTTSRPVPIRAVVAGPAGNTGPGTIVKFGSAPSDMAVTNPKAVTGGASRDTHMVLDSDYASATASLHDKLAADLQAALRIQATGMKYVVDGAPAFRATSDHAVGDETPTFTITMTASVQANGFSDLRARKLIADALRAQVPAGQEITADPIRTSYDIRQLTSSGDVTLTGSAVGFVIPRISTRSLQARIASMSPDEARRELEQVAPGARVRIVVYPRGLPWLPVIAGHIRFRIEPSSPA